MPADQTQKIQKSIHEKYGLIARSNQQGCGCGSSSCCDGSDAVMLHDLSAKIGYTASELESVPEGSNLALGCGNPQAIADLSVGEVVLDLGSGAGFDCFLAAQKVGASGSVIGVDMTPDMIQKARENAAKGNYDNVTFRLGEIEHLPVDDHSIDVIISNCVINLSTDKPQVFAEAFRVLKPGGRLAISDVVATADLPDEVKEDLVLYSACISGAMHIDVLENVLSAAGFEAIEIRAHDESREYIHAWAPETNPEVYIQAVSIKAHKPVQ